MHLGEEGVEVKWLFTSTRAPAGKECFQGIVEWGAAASGVPL